MKDSDDRRLNSGQPLFRLHDIAAQRGDGLIPQLYDLFSREIGMQPRGDNIVAFPRRENSGSGNVTGDGAVVDLMESRRKDKL